MKKMTSLLLFCCLLGATPAWAKGYTPAFEKVDLNKDGRISMPELLYLRRQGFKKADRNQDGVLTVAEILQLMPFFIRDRAKGPLTEYFKTQDKNKDGKVVLEELLQHIRQNFPKADKNGDGLLDQQEYKQGAERL